MRQVLILVMIAAGFAASAVQAAPLVVRDLEYVPGGGNQRALDLYVPEGATNAPLVVYMHGGGWQSGDKSENLPDFNRFLDAGMAVASINYTLVQSGPGGRRTQWPAQLNDVTAAFSYLRDEAARYGYDAGRMASFGSSSGGHLAAWAGLALAGDPATRLAASVTWSAPTDLFEMDNDADADLTRADAVTHGAPGSPESALIGGAVRRNEALADAASPAVFAEGLAPGTELPDFLVMHGVRDSIVSYLQAQRLHEALLGAGAESELDLLRTGHGVSAFYDPDRGIDEMDRVVDFLSASFWGQSLFSAASMSSMAAIPVPATLPMAVSALGLLGWLGRRRRRAL